MTEQVRRGAYARHAPQAPRPDPPEEPPQPPPEPPAADLKQVGPPWPRCRVCHLHPVSISIDGGRSGWCWCHVPTE